MAAVGLGTSLSVFRSVGLRPLAVGLAGALVVGATGAAGAKALAAWYGWGAARQPAASGSNDSARTTPNQ
jgi:hypothetical protein